MKPPALRRFALAAFLLFGVLGLVSILMESSIRVFSWPFILMQTIAAGGMAASIVLLGRKKWWVTLLVVVFWSGVMLYNGGGVGFIFGDDGSFHVRLGGLDRAGRRASMSADASKTLTGPELEAVYLQRGIVGTGVIVLLVLGYITFTGVIRREVQGRARLETEVRIARDIQQNLLPAESLETDCCLVAGITLPTSEVGGDYHDFVPLGGRRLAVAIADVTGHGVGAGMVSAMTKSAFHIQLEHDPAPEALLTHLNRTLYDISDRRTFVTFAYAHINGETRELRLATAGHPPVLYREAATGKVFSFRSKGPGLGMKRDVRFEQGICVPYHAGDHLLLYTDGLLEAADAGGQQFGDQHLLEAFAGAQGSPAEMLASILVALEQFAGRKEGFEDDISAVCVRLR